MKNLFVLLALCACNGDHKMILQPDGPPIDSQPPPNPMALVAAGDFTAGHPGTLGAVDVVTRQATQNAAPAGAVGDDPMLRLIGGELFVVSRADGNNVTILDAKTRALIEQIATGPSSNPQDVAALGTKLYVPIYGGAGVAVLARGGGTASLIDLSSFDPDGKPNCVSNYLIGTTLYIACEIADDANFFTPRGPGKVFLYDTTTDMITGSVTMQNVNPFGVFQRLPSGDLAIPTVDFANGGGCVERIITGANPASGGCIVTNTQLQAAYANSMAVDLNALLIAVTTPDYMHANVQRFDLTTNTLAAQPITPATEIDGDVAVCRDGSIVVSDGTMNASGVRIYRNGVEVTSAPIPIGLSTKSANAIVCY